MITVWVLVVGGNGLISTKYVKVQWHSAPVVMTPIDCGCDHVGCGTIVGAGVGAAERIVGGVPWMGATGQIST